jgi:protein-disulfide isomerase
MQEIRAIVIGLCLLALAGCRVADGGGPLLETISLDGMGYSQGLGTAPVTVVEFSDFGCPFCASFAFDTYPELHAEFVLPGQVRWIYVPYVLGMFPNGDAAAIAGECAGDQDRFWPMHHLLFENQHVWRNASSEDVFFRIAHEARLEADTFERCFRENEPRARIARQNRTGARLGIRATPTFVINGRVVEGALPVSQFRALLEFAIDAAD